MRMFVHQGGFSILEVVVALGVISIALTGTLNLFTTGFKSLAFSDKMTVALNAARAKLEEIKGAEFSQITLLYPDGSTYPVSNLNGGTLRVEYPNGISSDPLVVRVTVTWPEGGVERSIDLVTMVSSG
ncbi:TPA: type II secretion system protein [Candidatus Poribacteria bacterium]|nr:type II secretion system protein [Candidatus Poribacteria bacterium]HEX29797.1 type II secretion system protein [Candidatus Poribacteria bacterium]